MVYSAPKREQLAILIEQIVESEKEAADIGKALKVASGVVSRKLQEDMNRLEELYTAQIKRRDELQIAVNVKTMTNENIQAAMRFREDVLVGMKTPTFEDKRRTLELLRVVTTVKDGKARVRCLVPIGERVIDLRTA